MRLSLRHKPAIFHGYWVLMVGFLCVFFSAGCTAYTFSLFVKSLQTDFGWGRGQIMGAYTVLSILAGLASFPIGKIVDQHGGQKVISAGALLTGAGFILLSRIDQLWQFYALYIVIGFGIAAFGHVSASTVVSSWFDRGRGLIIGIMSTGIGLGGFALAPLFGGYLIPNLGWRLSYLILGVLTCVVLVPSSLLVMKKRPAGDGHADSPHGSSASQMQPRRLSPRIVLATLVFWLLAISYLVNGFNQSGVMLSQSPHLLDIGLPPEIAATGLGLVGLASAFGKFGFGWLCDKIQAKYAFCMGLFLQLAAVTMLIFVEPRLLERLIWLYAVLFGLGIGSWLPTMSIMVSTTYGLASYGAIYGLVNVFQSIGMATGPLAAGYLYDISGSYFWPFVVFMILYVLCAPTILLVRRPKSS